jgi:hypothetical protein
MTPLDNLITLAEASVAAGLAELKRETTARLCEQAGTLDRIVREHAARSERLPPSGPRIAPKRIAPPTTPSTPREPDTFTRIASRLRHP